MCRHFLQFPPRGMGVRQTRQIYFHVTTSASKQYILVLCEETIKFKVVPDSKYLLYITAVLNRMEANKNPPLKN